MDVEGVLSGNFRVDTGGEQLINCNQLVKSKHSALSSVPGKMFSSCA